MLTWRGWLALEAKRFRWSFLGQWHRWRMGHYQPRSEPWKAHFLAILTCNHNRKEVGMIRPYPPEAEPQPDQE